MGLFKKKKQPVLQQDLTKKEENDRVFIMHLLMKEHCEMPDRQQMISVMEKHLGSADCFCHEEKMAGFAIQKYQVEYKDGTFPPQLFAMECMPIEDYSLDVLTRSQMWDCPNSEEILEECKYHVIAMDMMAFGMNYQERADMLMDYLEALMELYPTCVAVQFQTSGKMFTREKIINHQLSKESRFIYFAVNARFFNIQNSEDMIVDTLGMHILGLPDLQYHFHDMNPNWVVNHAYNIASYMYDHQNPIKDGDTIDGMEDGSLSQEVQWICQYEQSLIQPVREVIDVCMNEYASGNRNKEE